MPAQTTFQRVPGGGGFSPDYSRPYSAEFKNEWSYTFTSPYP
jgi:hypothetical protein